MRETVSYIMVLYFRLSLILSQCGDLKTGVVWKDLSATYEH